MDASSADPASDRAARPVAKPIHAQLPGGFLAGLPEAARERLLAHAIRINVPAGAFVYRSDEEPRVIVVVGGLLRVFLHAADGRQVIVRYVRAGDIAGLALAIGGPGPMSIQAMTSSSVVALRVDTLRSLLATEPGVARACAEELTRQLYQILDDLAGQAFLSLRERIILELLDLAQPGEGAKLVVHVRHEELAEATASVREVVTRILDQLRDEGLISTSRSEIVLLDPIALGREVAACAPRAPGSRASPAAGTTATR